MRLRRNGTLENTITCPLCGKDKSMRLDAVYCSRKCTSKAGNLRANYNITAIEYRKLLEKFDNRCAICGTTKNLAVDHDHSCCPGVKSCGKCIRGILCRPHNVGIGMLGDSTHNLSSAISYLDSYEPSAYQTYRQHAAV